MRRQISGVHQNGASRIYGWKLIFGPAHAHTDVRFLTEEIRYDSKKRRSLELNSGPAHVKKILDFIRTVQAAGLVH
jgi:hypothetical protein